MAQDTGNYPRPCGELQPIYDLATSGLLWLINRTVFHPRGLALALNFEEDGEATGWLLLAADKGEPFSFPDRDDKTGYQRAEATLRAALSREEH